MKSELGFIGFMDDVGIGFLINFGFKILLFKMLYNISHPENKDYIANNPRIIKS